MANIINGIMRGGGSKDYLFHKGKWKSGITPTYGSDTSIDSTTGYIKTTAIHSTTVSDGTMMVLFPYSDGNKIVFVEWYTTSNPEINCQRLWNGTKTTNNTSAYAQQYGGDISNIDLVLGIASGTKIGFQNGYCTPAFIKAIWVEDAE